MIFTYNNWENMCEELANNGIHCIPACDVNHCNSMYVVLKHDVETKVQKAYKMAQIEFKYGHRGSYYIQAYLLNSIQNQKLLRKMQKMGHEISYHYDVMDSCKGDIDKALDEFEKNKNLFERNGFILETVCQHGNPVFERIGYTSNRDFFRNKKTLARYPNIVDIMVNFKESANTEFSYFSDAGRKFKKIFDPINNDVFYSEDKDIPFDKSDDLLSSIIKEGSSILSIHPHRWSKSQTIYLIELAAFKVVKSTAKAFMKIPGMKKLACKYYYLAKKI